MNKLSLKKLFIGILLALAAPSLLFARDADRDASVKNLEASDALSELRRGNERFILGKNRIDGQRKEDILRLADGQKPRAVVLSCSDSRVPPEAVFDQKLGEIFTVRSAGEALSPQAIGSIEYAVEKLNSHLIVVLGHTNCGAVKAAVETIGGQTAGSENLDRLVGDIHPRIKGKFDPKRPSKDLEKESWLNARGVAKDLLARSSLISKAVSSGKVEIKVAMYNLTSGEVKSE